MIEAAVTNTCSCYKRTVRVLLITLLKPPLLARVQLLLLVKRGTL